MKALNNARLIKFLLDEDWNINTENMLQDKLDLAKKELEMALPLTNDRKELDQILELDTDYTMPVEQMIQVYRRIIELDSNDEEIQKIYAQYLLLHGPDWDDEAHRILSKWEKGDYL